MTYCRYNTKVAHGYQARQSASSVIQYGHCWRSQISRRSDDYTAASGYRNLCVRNHRVQVIGWRTPFHRDGGGGGDKLLCNTSQFTVARRRCRSFPSLNVVHHKEQGGTVIRGACKYFATAVRNYYCTDRSVPV
jgi:hypothetical protein